MKEILQYTELIKNLTISDLKTKYAGSVLGFAWSMLNPLLLMLVLYFVFSNIFRMQEENFALYILIGIVTWRFFAIGTLSAMGSIVGKASLVTKIYIPREILVLSSALSSLISSLLEFLVLVPLVFILGPTISGTAVLFPLIHLLYFIIIFGFGLILASLFVYFRDLNQIWDVVLNLGFFLTPIVYPLSLVPQKYLFYYMLNPITRLMEMYRGVILYGRLPTIADFAIVLLSGLALFVLGNLTFGRLSRRFAEEI